MTGAHDSVEHFAAPQNERALFQLRARLAEEQSQYLRVALDVLQNALYGRLGEVEYGMRAANLTEEERNAAEVTLHNLAQIVVDVQTWQEEGDPKDWCRIFATDDLRVIMGVPT